jgi:serine/threonine protein phosphatase PrpC
MPNAQMERADLQVLACTGQHLGDRAEQQDRVAVLSSVRAPRCALGLLADGLGGMTGGAMAAQQVITTTQRLFNEFDPTAATPAEFFAQLVREVHLLIKLAGYTSRLAPHSTMTAVLIQPRRVDWCHVGDSRIYCFRDGALLHRTVDHTFAQHLIAERAVEPTKAYLHPKAGLLTNSLGGEPDPVPTLGSTTDMADGQSFLLCSDGLWGYFKWKELAEIVRRLPPREAAELLVDLARERAAGKGDNCSLVLMQLKQRQRQRQKKIVGSARSASKKPDRVETY